MGLAREDELDRMLGVGQHRAEPVEVGEDEDRPLVGGETAREADGERTGIEQALHPAQVVGGEAVAGALHPDALAHEAHQALLLRAVGGPQLVVGNLGHAVPQLRLQQVLRPGGVDVLRVERPHLGADPRLRVHAVGDRRDG